MTFSAQQFWSDGTAQACEQAPASAIGRSPGIVLATYAVMANLTVQFSGIQRAYDLTLGPFAVIRITGNFMRAGPDNHVVAAYAKHQWEAQGRHYTSYKCVGPVTACFEDHLGTASARFGPFEVMRVADGTMYAGEALFAKFIDETILWHSFELETWWPTLVVEAGSG